MGWQEADIRGRTEDYHCKAYKRNPLAVLQEILENSAIKDKMVWAPRKTFDHAGKRVYTDLHTSEWWWRMQVCIDKRDSLLTSKGTRQTAQPVEPRKSNDNSDHPDVRQNPTRGLFRHGYRLAFIHVNRECRRVRTIQTIQPMRSPHCMVAHRYRYKPKAWQVTE